MTKLHELVKEQINGLKLENPQRITIADKIEFFKKRVDEFYLLVMDDWLKELVDDNLVNETRERMTITEEQTGSYEIDALHITMGNISLFFKPVGTILIGTPGRIDMYVNNQSDSAMFILTGEKAKSPRIISQVSVEGESRPERPKPVDMEPVVWKYVERNGHINYRSLDSATFQNIIISRVK